MKIKELLISIAIPLGVGILSAIITMNNQNIYEFINVPSFAPPGFLFPIVWTILYILMGISSYLVYNTGGIDTSSALGIYIIQLILNFFWSIIFFNLRNFNFAFIWIILLLISIIIMIYRFYKVNKLAGLLNVPYLLWVTFASILNLAIVILN